MAVFSGMAIVGLGLLGFGLWFLRLIGVFVDVSSIVDRRFEWSAGLVACGLMSERVGSCSLAWFCGSLRGWVR